MKRGLDMRKAEAALKRAAHKALHGTREERSGRIISSMIRDVAYDLRSHHLDVRFVSGRAYRYSNVPPEIYERFLNAASKGDFFNTCIRGHYNYQAL